MYSGIIAVAVTGLHTSKVSQCCMKMCFYDLLTREDEMNHRILSLFFSLSPATSPGLAHSVVAFWIKLYPMMMRRQSGKMTAYTRGKLYRKSFMCVYTYKELCMCAYKVLFTKASTSPYTLHITFCDFYKFIMWTFHRQCVGQDNLFV